MYELSPRNYVNFFSDLNYSELDFYNNVMTFNDSVVEATCCKLNGRPTQVVCGQGRSCAAACFSLDATLCPSGDCENCDTSLDTREARSWSTLGSAALRKCLPRCNVRGKRKFCCFHPTCRQRKQKECDEWRYLSGKHLKKKQLHSSFPRRQLLSTPPENRSWTLVM